MNKTKLDAALHAAGVKRFDSYYIAAKDDAQRNLVGRTHYVDQQTLKFHKARIISTHLSGDSLLFAIVETCAGDWQNRTRICRSVVFDVFGNVIEREKHAGPADARKHLATVLEGGAYSHTIKALRDRMILRRAEANKVLDLLVDLEMEAA
jgi:hypothetical protein